MTRDDTPAFLTTLDAWATSQPDTVAVWDSGVEICYATFCDLVASTATMLSAAGLKPGDRVALVADNCAEYLIAAFGVWKAAGVLVTVYPSLGATDLAYCLRSADPVLVIADRRAGAAVRDAAPVDVPVVDLDRHLVVDQLTTHCEATPPDLVQDLALICFTSGSTDVPKAVMHSHSGLSRAAAAYAEVWHLGRDDRTVVCLPMAWAFGLVTTSMATLFGGGTVLALARTKPEMLIAAITEQGATFLAGVTTIFAKLVEHLDGLTHPPSMPTLRLCISGGEPRNEHVFANWLSMTGTPVHDVYAASECFPVVTYDPNVDPIPVRRSSGKVVHGARMRLVDPEGRDVAPGQSGEAFWTGPALLLGYWKDEALTAKALTEDGWYRTNDLVRVDSDGYVFVEGRLSDMIIRGGSNVSPGEVETVLGGHVSVKQAAVVGIEDEIYGQRVVAAVVAADPDTFDAVDLQAYCRSQLAGYKVPTVIVLVDELPLHPATGKVDRKRVAAQLRTSGRVA